MELTNEFTIDRPVDETWRILNDLEFIAPCMPGAQLQEIEGEEFRGIVKIKVGPITAKYSGKARFIEQNEPEKTARLKAEGRDPRQGNANAIITATMHTVDETSTAVKIHTDLSLSGKIASFGRGAIEDVSAKLIGQFTDNLRDKLENEGAEAEPEAVVTEPATVETAAGEAAPASTVRKIEAPEPEPVDILAVTGSTAAKRIGPVVGGVLLLILLRILLKRR